MRMHKNFAWFCLLGVLFLGLSSGAVLVARTINEYSGACEKLNGFPGMLQSAGFVPIGNCKFIKGKCPGPKQEQCVVNGKPGALRRGLRSTARAFASAKRTALAVNKTAKPERLHAPGGMGRSYDPRTPRQR